MEAGSVHSNGHSDSGEQAEHKTLMGCRQQTGFSGALWEKYEKEYINKISVIKDVAVCSDCEPKGFTREFVTNEMLLKSRSFIPKSYVSI